MVRIEQEKKMVELMVHIYCRKHNHLNFYSSNKDLCEKCLALSTYAQKRLDRCVYGVKKSSCKRCPTHCYNLEMRSRVREVMRFSGPRMLFYAPFQTIRHWLLK